MKIGEENNKKKKQFRTIIKSEFLMLSTTVHFYYIICASFFVSFVLLWLSLGHLNTSISVKNTFNYLQLGHVSYFPPVKEKLLYFLPLYS